MGESKINTVQSKINIIARNLNFFFFLILCYIHTNVYAHRKQLNHPLKKEKNRIYILLSRNGFSSISSGNLTSKMLIK